MKKEFIFDKVESDIIDIEESTVIKDTGIDAAKVKETIMKEIKSGKKSKKVSAGKIFSIVAIAAAIAAAATVTASATTGVFNPAFGELFAGQPANGVFPGTDISINSDQLDIEFVGVTGNETNMFSIYNITKKDNSSFVDSTDNYIFLGTNAEMNVTQSAYKMLKLALDSSRGWGSGVEYTFADEKTIRATVSYSDTAGCIKGERLTVTDKETSFYHVDEVIYADASDTFMGCSEFMEKNKDLMEKKEAALGGDQFITEIIRDGHAELVTVTSTTIPFEYDLGVKLNYKTTEKIFTDAAGKALNALNTDWTIKEIKADSFEITIEATTEHFNLYEDFDTDNQEGWTDEELHRYLNTPTDLQLLITLKDGTVVHANGSSVGRFTYGGTGEYTWHCVYFTDENSKKSFALDANEIVSVSCNGTDLI